LGIVHGWDPDSDSFSNPRSSETPDPSIRIVVCLCKAHVSEQTTQVCPISGNPTERIRASEKERSDAISYMNNFGGWLQEGDIFQGTIIEFLVIG
jgi:hypothetical protein